MNRKQMRLIRLLSIILLLLLAVFLVLFSDRLNPERNPDGPVPTTEHIPLTSFATPSPEADPSHGPDNPPSGTNPDGTVSKPAYLFDVTGSNPHTTLFHIVRTGSEITADGIAYSNYFNAVKTIYPNGATLTFSDDGYYTFIGADQVSHTYRIADHVDLTELFSGLSSASDGNWFFLGALETRDYIYVSYDFWAVDELTLYFRMDKTGRDVHLVYATGYDEQENQGIFAASNEYIFYFYTTHDTETGAIETSLMQAESDGSKSGILLPLSDGYSAHHLSLTDGALIFMVTDPNGKTSLLRLDTLTQELTYIAEELRTSEYLYLHDAFAVVGTDGSSLVLYGLNSCEEVLIPLGEAASRSLGLPVCDDSHLYLQYFRWDAKSDTTLLRIDAAARTTTPLVLQANELCYVTGITKDFLYAEYSGSYLTFPLP